MIELTERGLAALREDRARRDGWLAGAIAASLTDEELHSAATHRDLPLP